MAQVATTFKYPEQMMIAWEKVGGSTSDVAQRLIRQSGGDLESLAPLVDRALDDAFNVKMRGRSLETCLYLPEHLRPRIRELLTAR